MPTHTDAPRRLAVLIDADNVSASVIAPLLAEIANYGAATVRRIYGDWTLPNLGSWKAVLAEHSIVPIQQFRNTTGKNATDSAMIIDAMDLLHTGRLDGFCLVSSDSDFTRLASRIREQGVPVYGFGESKTPRAFIAACDRFVFTDVLTGRSGSGAGKAAPLKSAKGDAQLAALLRRVVDASADETGWAALGDVASRMAQQESDFDPRVYGFSRLRPLIEEIGIFDLEERPGAQGHKHLWLRNRRKGAEPVAPETEGGETESAGKGSKRGRRGGRKKSKADKTDKADSK
jgi:uncharacterized LabA/DUF88 family protein